jgi:guanosine-3',5'-bis(diphosphate) 3'-pyrophosphohydrolase
MLIQEAYQKAIKFAGEVHANQKIPGSNANHMVHISNVAMELLVAYQNQPDFDIILAIQVGILHDSIEDNPDVNHSTIAQEFGLEVADGVLALSKDTSIVLKSDKIKDSVQRILKQPKEIALVKLADRITNLQKPPSTWSNEKILAYYKDAKYILQKLKGHNEYLDIRFIDELNKYDSYIDIN